MGYSVLSDEVLRKYNVRGRFCRCAAGEPGPAGPMGPMGPAGPRGPRGLPGTAVTAQCMAAYNNNCDEIKLKPSGTSVKLPVHDVLDGFSANAADTVFGVCESGTYLVSYGVYLECEGILSSRITVNNTPAPGLEIMPSELRAVYSCQTLLRLKKGDKLSLILYAPSATVKLQNGTGAYLNIIRMG